MECSRRTLHPSPETPFSYISVWCFAMSWCAKLECPGGASQGPHDDPNAPNSCAAKNNPKTPCGCTPCPQVIPPSRAPLPSPLPAPPSNRCAFEERQQWERLQSLSRKSVSRVSSADLGCVLSADAWIRLLPLRQLLRAARLSPRDARRCDHPPASLAWGALARRSAAANRVAPVVCRVAAAQQQWE